VRVAAECHARLLGSASSSGYDRGACRCYANVRDRLVEGKRDRITDKDALDILRLLRGCDDAEVAERMKKLLSLRDAADATPRATATVTEEAVAVLRAEFGIPAGRGCEMAVRAATGALEKGEVRASTVDLVQRLLRRLGPSAWTPPL
jgi:hypothetical protein